MNRFSQNVLLALGFCAGFALTSVVIDQVALPIRVPEHSEKLTQLAENPGSHQFAIRQSEARAGSCSTL